MLNVHPAEFLIIGLVLLIAVGPEQLPGVIRKIGHTVAQLRSMTDGLRSEFMAGLDDMERVANPSKWSSSDGGGGSSDGVRRSTDRVVDSSDGASGSPTRGSLDRSAEVPEEPTTSPDELDRGGDR